MAATLKPGRRVQLPEGKTGVIIHLGGMASSQFVDPAGNADSYDNKVQQGQALIYEVDPAGGFVMEKHPQFMKFRTKEIVLPVSDLVAITD